MGRWNLWVSSFHIGAAFQLNRPFKTLCSLTFSGETSAGKSTLINLLIGEEILPYSVLHKTTAICCLHHSATKRLVYDESGHRIEHHLDKSFLAKALSKMLDEIMENTTIKLIDIYWPIVLLENQVYLFVLVLFVSAKCN